MSSGLVDSHAHLEAMSDLNVVLLRAKEAGIAKIVSCGSSVEWSRKCIDIAEKNSGNLVDIFACCGVHPEDGREEIKKSDFQYLDELRELAKSKKVVAIGECGLDYRGDESATEKKFQKGLFENQLDLALKLDLPVVIHCRNGWADIFEPISKRSALRGMFHSWTGGLLDAKRAVDLGFNISFSGIITFKNAGEIVDVAKWVPIDRMLIETDSPFLTPMPDRGKPNEPKNVKITAQFLAELRGESLDTIAEVTARNAENLFSI